MDWRSRKLQCFGSALFRGRMPPRAEEFAHLARSGIDVEPHRGASNAHWAMDLRHPEWGSAVAVCLRDVPAPPPVLIQWDAALCPEEREAALTGQSTVTVQLLDPEGSILRDRKRLLRFLRAVMGRDGVVAIDHLASRFWSPQALDDELCHDADLDIDALYCLHAVRPEGADRPTWLHTHGLGEMGFFDFDILQPCEDLFTSAVDIPRAIAFAIVEGKLKPTTTHFRLACGGGDIRMVEVGEFLRRAEPEALALRLDADPEHNRGRAVICDPARGLVTRWFGKVRPSSFLSSGIEDHHLLQFSDEASALQAERAKLSYKLFRSIAEEVADLGGPRIVKLGYPMDDDAAGRREHMWFEVHQMLDDRLEATLRSVPVAIASMHEGERGWHDVETISDWAIITPAGMVTPRNTTPARAIRSRPETFRRTMAPDRQQGGKSG